MILTKSEHKAACEAGVKSNKYNGLDFAAMLAFKKSGIPLKQIAKYYNISIKSIERNIKKLEILAKNFE